MPLEHIKSAFLNTDLVSLVASLFFAMVIFMAVNIISPCTNYVVKRFFRPHSVLEPGVNFIIPFLDRVSHRISILERQLPSFSQNARTEDDALIKIAISLINRIKKPEKTALKATNVDAAITNTVADILRAEISKIQATQIQ
jgi:regulator of protease activity HflC (stomatin/prohibitin superfamily)